MGNKSNKAAQAAKETAPEAAANQEESVAQETPQEGEAAQPETAPEQEAEEATKAAEKTKTAAKAAAKKPKYPAFLDGYIKAYPKEKVFHVTADKQVFLDKDYHFAKAHQDGLGKGEITTYNI